MVLRWCARVLDFSAALLVALACGGGAGWATSDGAEDGALRAETITLRVYWRSSSYSVNGQADELNELYTGLSALATEGWQVPTVEAQIGKSSPSILALTRKRALFVGPFYPKALDSWLCKMNEPICNANCNRADDFRPRWCHGTDVEVRVPDIRITSRIVAAPYNKRRGDTIASIVTRDRRGCKDFDRICMNTVVNLNGGKKEVLSTEYEGRVIIPSSAYEAYIELSVPAGGAIERTVINRDRTTTRIVDISEKAESQFVNAFGSSISNIMPLDVRSTPRPQSGACGAPGNELTVDRLGLFKMINHPASYGLRQPEGRNDVILYDGWLQKDHCGLNVTTWLPDSNASVPAYSNLSCGSNARIIDVDSAHATHLAGLLAGTEQNHRQQGIFSRLRLHAVQVSPGRFVVSPEALLRASAVIDSTIKLEQFSVANMSWGYPDSFTRFATVDGFDPIRQTIDQLEWTLFVVAAGNSGRAVGSRSGCRFLPACHEAPNLISVVASGMDDGKPVLLSCSNHGSAFDIIAPGADLESAVPGNGWATMSGTSQSAAVVTGVASMLKSACPGKRPQQLKERLIVSSDFYGTLRNAAYGGLVNVVKALNVKKEQITFRTESGASVTLYGGRDVADLYISLLRPKENGKPATEPMTVRLPTVERLTQVIEPKNESGHWVLFFRGQTLEEKTPKDASLRKVTADAISFLSDFAFSGKPLSGGEDQSVKVVRGHENDLLDFVGAMVPRNGCL